MGRVLNVEIVSRFGGKGWSGQATRVSVPLADGELGVLPGRQPILAILGRGEVRIAAQDGEAVVVPVAGGFCSVDHDAVTVAADYCGDDATDRSRQVSDVMAEAAQFNRTGREG